MFKAVKYNPAIHHRRSLRLKGYDYSRKGMYFITICCQDHEHRFGYIKNQIMVLNQFGIIAQKEWYKLPGRFQNLKLGAFQVMPNHIHGIIILHENIEGATLAVAPSITPDANGNAIAPDANGNAVAPIHDEPSDVLDDKQGAGSSPAPAIGTSTDTPSNQTVGNIIGAYKSLVAYECLKICKSKNEKMGKLWQRNYYERIIRNERSYIFITAYILKNPRKWNDDKSTK